MTNLQKPYTVVVGVDFESLGDVALDAAFRAASGHADGEVHVIHVAQDLGGQLFIEGGDKMLFTMEEAARHLQSHVATRLAEFTRKNPSGANFAKVVTHIRVDAKAQEIAQLASDLEAELVVIGTHGRRGINRVLMGSVAEACVRLAPCPVLVMRPNRAPSVPTIEPPCPECVNARFESKGETLWCEQHRERHGRRHTYNFVDRTNRPRESLPGLGSED